MHHCGVQRCGRCACRVVFATTPGAGELLNRPGPRVWRGLTPPGDTRMGKGAAEGINGHRVIVLLDLGPLADGTRVNERRERLPGVQVRRPLRTRWGRGAGRGRTAAHWQGRRLRQNPGLSLQLEAVSQMWVRRQVVGSTVMVARVVLLVGALAGGLSGIHGEVRADEDFCLLRVGSGDYQPGA